MHESAWRGTRNVCGNEMVTNRRAAPSCHGASWSVSLSIAAVLFLASPAPSCADPAPVIHYSPADNLERVDVGLIIDMAAYVLTDWPIMLALTRAADRGVKVRIYLDGTQLAEREPSKVFQDLAETPTVEIRTKRDHGAPMHLKSYQIDGQLCPNRRGERKTKSTGH
jgi:hypothetical protein